MEIHFEFLKSDTYCRNGEELICSCFVSEVYEFNIKQH